MNRVLTINTDRTREIASWLSLNAPQTQHRTSRPDGRVTITITFADDEDTVLFHMAWEGRFAVVSEGQWRDKVETLGVQLGRMMAAMSVGVASLQSHLQDLEDNLPDEPPPPKGRWVAPNSSIKSARQARALR